MNLLETQRSFREWLSCESETAAARLGAAAAPGLAVHLNTYRSQLLSCLAETFGVVRARLGATAFDGAAAIHIERVPPSAWTLDAYARDFADTLTGLYPSSPELAELARLEEALAAAFTAADCESIAPGALDYAQIDWETAVLHPVTTFRLLPVRTNAAAIWSAITRDEAPPTASLLDAPTQLAVWRDGFTPGFRALEPAEAAALAQLAGGATFGAVCAALVEERGAVRGPEVAGAWLGQWFREGLIAKMS